VVGPIPEGRDADDYDRLRRRVLWSLPTGLFVVGSRSGGERNLMTCNWVMQVATSPKLVAAAIERGSVTARLVETGGGFTVSILPRSARSVVRRFVKPTAEVELDAEGRAVLMQGEPVVEHRGGLPRVAVARAWLTCSLHRVVAWDTGPGEDAASHLLMVGEVVDAGEHPEEGGTEEGVLRMEDTRMNYGG
jgi:flavin reductase (DIM6/NTAB) family NADH-FMN oxidoreductase RutF